MLHLRTALGLTTEYRVNFRGLYRAVEPLNHITLTEQPLSCQATKIYAFTCSLNFILLYPFLRLSYTVNPLLSYPGSRGYFCVVWAGMRKVASANNHSILYRTCARVITQFSSKKSSCLSPSLLLEVHRNQTCAQLCSHFQFVFSSFSL